MKLSAPREFEDLKFAVHLLDPEVEITESEEIKLNDQDTTNQHIEGFENVATFLLNKYQPSKSLKDLKKIRNGLDQQPCEKLLISLISYYNHFKALLTTSNLKNIKYVELFTNNLNLHYLYFYLLNIQVGLVLDAVEAEGSDKLFIETIDLGDHKTQIVSGVRPFISKEQFVGKKFLFLTNIKKSKIMGIESHGMILCGKEGDNVSLIKVGDDIPVGTRLTLESPNIVSEYGIPKIDLKKSFFNNVFSGLKIVNGFIEYSDIRACLNSVALQTEVCNGTIS